MPVLGGRGKERWARWVMLGALAATFITVIICSNAVEHLSQTYAFGRMFALDRFSIFFKLLFIGAVALVVMLSDDFLNEGRYSQWEYYSLLAFALIGMMFMVSGVHLISIYIGLELLSLPSYILPASYRNARQPSQPSPHPFIP